MGPSSAVSQLLTHRLGIGALCGVWSPVRRHLRAVWINDLTFPGEEVLRTLNGGLLEGTGQGWTGAMLVTRGPDGVGNPSKVILVQLEASPLSKRPSIWQNSLLPPCPPKMACGASTFTPYVWPCTRSHTLAHQMPIAVCAGSFIPLFYNLLYLLSGL